MKRYKDCNNREIKKGMVLEHIETGELEEVCSTDHGDLGFDCTNRKWSGWDGITLSIMTLCNFNLAEWRIVDNA